MRKSFVSLWLSGALLTMPMAQADSLTHYPGWSVDKIVRPQEEGAYDTGPDFYSLSPPDGRPAVTIDSATAGRLRRAELAAEAAYSGATSRSAAKPDEEHVYGSNRGYAPGPEVADGSTPPASVSAPREGAERSDSFSASAFGHAGGGGDGGGGGFQSSPTYAQDLGRSGYQANSASDLPRVSSGASSSSPSSAAPTVIASNSNGSAAGEARASSSSSFSAPPTSFTAGGYRAPASESKRTASAFKSEDPEKNRAKPAKEEAEDDEEGDEDEKDKTGTKKKKDTKECVAVDKVFDRPGRYRIPVAKSCKGSVSISAFGAGGGQALQGPAAGSGGFVSTSGKFDVSVYDLVVVVGGAGGAAIAGQGGSGGSSGGAPGGDSSYQSGGGGGGFSGVFLSDKRTTSTTASAKNALAVAAGGGGASHMDIGGHGGGDNAGGADPLMAQGGQDGLYHPQCAQVPLSSPCSVSQGEGENTATTQVPHDYMSQGGGGGGGGMAGGKGGGAAAAGGKSFGGTGGTNYCKFESKTMAAGGSSTFTSHPERNGAGSAGAGGRVILKMQ